MPLSLRALLDSVRINHPMVRAAETLVRAAQGSRMTARAFGNPVISYQVDQTPFPGASSIPGLDREAITTATFPLEGFFQRAPRVRRANAQVRAAEADAAAMRQRIGLDAVTAYYRTAFAQVQVATTTDLVGWLDTLVTYNRSRVKEGVTAEADLIRSELERDRMAAEAALHGAELIQARAALDAFLPAAGALDQFAGVAVDGMPLRLPPTAAQPLSISTAGLGKPSPVAPSIEARPDIRAARARVSATTAGVASERSLLFRQLGVTIGTMQSAGYTAMVAGISVPLPVFDANSGEIQRAGAERDAATLELAARERAATVELRGALEAALLLTDRATTLARRDTGAFLARAEESRRIALGAYREGAVPLFLVIDAARAWSDARLTYYRAVFAQHQSVLALTVAEGSDLFATEPAHGAPAGSGR